MFGRKIRRKSALCSCLCFASTEVMHRSRSDSPLQVDIVNTHQIRTEKQHASARRLLPATLLERWPQICRFKITFELLLNNWFVSTKTNSMKCFVNWIPANSHVHSNKTQLNADSSRKRSRNYSRELRERTSLSNVEPSRSLNKGTIVFP